MGLSLGASQGGSSSSTQSSSQANSTPTFSADQTSLQSMLSGVLSSLLPAAGSGGISAPVQAIETGNANAINETSSTTGTAMNRFLAARGFGQSGQTGQAALQTELGRQAALGQNGANAGALQLQQNNTALSDALNFAFNTPGTQNAGSANASGTSSNWGFTEGVAASLVPGAPN